MVVTMLDASVAEDRVPDLLDAYGTASGDLPPFIVETFLLRSGNSWRIATVWTSREDLEAYRASVETPAGILAFRAAGAEPDLTIFDVERHAAH